MGKTVLTNRLFHAQTDGILNADVVLHAQHLEVTLQVFIHPNSYRSHSYIMTDSCLAVNYMYQLALECFRRHGFGAAERRQGPGTGSLTHDLHAAARILLSDHGVEKRHFFLTDHPAV